MHWGSVRTGPRSVVVAAAAVIVIVIVIVVVAAAVAVTQGRAATLKAQSRLVIIMTLTTLITLI